MRPQDDPVSLLKILLISTLAFATLIPTFFVSGLIAEREARQGVVQSEFTRNWGPPQELRSPTLVVPYQSAPDRPRAYLKITPDRLSVTANLTPQERKRGRCGAAGATHLSLRRRPLSRQGADANIWRGVNCFTPGRFEW